MPFKHPPEFRERALELLEEVGMNEAARRLGVGRATLYYWKYPEKAKEASRRQSVRQNTATCPQCGGPKRKDNGNVCAHCKGATAREVRRRRAEGQSMFTIMLALGLSERQVRNHLINEYRRRKQ